MLCYAIVYFVKDKHSATVMCIHKCTCSSCGLDIKVSMCIHKCTCSTCGLDIKVSMCIHTCTCSTCGLDIKVSMCIHLFCYFSFYSLDSFFHSFIPSFIHLFLLSFNYSFFLSFFQCSDRGSSERFLSGFIPSC